MGIWERGQKNEGQRHWGVSQCEAHEECPVLRYGYSPSCQASQSRCIGGNDRRALPVKARVSGIHSKSWLTLNCIVVKVDRH